MNGYSVRNIPNEPHLRDLFKSLRKSKPYRARGRGVPAGKSWRKYHRGTPLGEAPKFTAYYGEAPYQYMEFVSIDADGIPHIRML